MIEKIREKVIIANNLDCKTYEEALEKECKFKNCLLLYKNFFFDEDDFLYKNDWYFSKRITVGELEATDYGIEFFKKREPSMSLSQYKILGLPITLERILHTLNFYYKKEKYDGIIYHHNALFSYVAKDESLFSLYYFCQWNNGTIERQNYHE